MSTDNANGEPSLLDSQSEDAAIAENTRRQCIWFLTGQLAADEPVRHVAINREKFLIGRRPTLNLCLPCRTVSSIHAEIVNTESSLSLLDLGSTNGTFVNGRRILESILLKEDDIVQFGDVALRVRKQSAQINTRTAREDVFDQALALVHFDELMAQQNVVPYFQPIVQLSDGHTVAHEVLGRSHVDGLETPHAMFRAAARLNLEVELSRMFRWKGIQAAAAFPDTSAAIFVNTHPLELDDPALYESMKSIRKLNTTHKITLEIHERAVTNPTKMAELRAVLNDLDIRLAYDDFGAGQARLNDLCEVPPDYIKFDISLIRNIHLVSSRRQNMIATLVQMVSELEVIPLAEGIESEAESRVCTQLGFELAQGFYFGRPRPAWLSKN